MIRGKNRVSRAAFTLVEIIVVIIILGILASVALPQVTKNIDIAKAMEAINFLGVAKKSVSDCYGISDDMRKCNNWYDDAVAPRPEMTIKAPAGNLRFSYAWSGGASAQEPPVLKATLLVNGVPSATDYIQFTYNINGSVTKVYAGKFQQLDK